MDQDGLNWQVRTQRQNMPQQIVNRKQAGGGEGSRYQKLHPVVLPEVKLV